MQKLTQNLLHLHLLWLPIHTWISFFASSKKLKNMILVFTNLKKSKKHELNLLQAFKS
eukprot:UN21631